MAKAYREDSWRKPAQEMELGDTFITKSRVITRTECELFALMGGDWFPQFFSEAVARKRGWKTQLVPGLCTLNIAYGLLMQGGFIKDVVAMMGTKNMEFLAPVHPGDSIRMETELTSKKETSKGWICEYDWAIINQEETMVAKGHNT